jgi:signal peptidase I
VIEGRHVDPESPIPLEMTGWSMAPWLRPGDLLLVDATADPAGLNLGEVVVFRDRESGHAVVHRIVARSEGTLPFRTKGDRNHEKDPPVPSWEFRGVVRRRFRNGEWKELRWRRFLWLLSVSGLYPGQRIPSWMSVRSLRKGVGCGGA